MSVGLRYVCFMAKIKQKITTKEEKENWRGLDTFFIKWLHITERQFLTGIKYKDLGASLGRYWDCKRIQVARNILKLYRGVYCSE